MYIYARSIPHTKKAHNNKMSEPALNSGFSYLVHNKVLRIYKNF